MSIADERLYEAVNKPGTKIEDKEVKVEQSAYVPTDLERNIRSRVLKDFTLGYQTMYVPRQEFNGLSTLQRDQVDSMAFNTYQPNNGESNDGDLANSWRSNAIRPIERNKAISMAGHAAGRLGFLKVHATDEESNANEDAAIMMNTLVEWVKANYFPQEWFTHAVLQSEVSPACIVHHEYREVYRPLKTKRKKDGSWEVKKVLDESNSGFIGTIVPTEQLFIDNIFERDIQKQRFVIWRRVQNHDQMAAKYRDKKNWEHVKRGMQLLFNDANQGFYFAYDPNLRGELAEEILYFSKENGGMQVTIVNGVVIGEADEKLQREDGLYPFAKWYYSWIRDNFFYGKSLIFSVSHDANIINTLYPVLVDGAILDTMKPMKYIGKDMIGSDVIIPGATITMRDPNSRLDPLMPPLQTVNLLNAMAEVEKSLDQTAQTQATPSNRPGNVTAYEMSLREAQLQQDLGPFYSELIGASVQLTRLVLGDILQFLTVADTSKIIGADKGLKYKKFLVNLGSGNKARQRKVDFQIIPDELADKDKALAASYDVLEEQGGLDSEVEIMKVDPIRARELKYAMVMTDDILKPKSEEVRFRQNLETLDKIIMLEQARPGMNNLEEAAKKLLYSTNEITARNPESFIAKQEGGVGAPGMPAEMPAGMQQLMGVAATPQSVQQSAQPQELVPTM